MTADDHTEWVALCTLSESLPELFVDLGQPTHYNHTKSGRPDFIFHESDISIGIEVTRLVEPKLRRAESEKDQIVQRAKQKAEDTGMLPLYVDVSFSPSASPSPSQRDTIANFILEQIRTDLDTLDGEPPENREIHTPPLLSGPASVVRRIGYRAYEKLTRHFWDTGGAGVVQEHCVEPIQQCITRKNPKLAEYNKYCQHCWLVVIGEYIAPSSFFHPNEQTLTHCYDSAFDRNFYVGFYPERVTELTRKGQEPVS